MPLPKQLLVAYVESLELAAGNADTSQHDDENEDGIHEIRSQIQSLKLTTWNTDIALLFKVADGPGDAYVGAGSAISFVAQLQPQLKRDVMYSTLFAQLGANTEHNRQEEPEKWFEAYIKILKTVGWDGQGQPLTVVQDARSYDSVDNLDLTLTKTVMSPSEFTLFKMMIESMDKSVNQDATKLFNISSMVATKASFQLGLVYESSGNAVMKFSANSYDIGATIVTVLFSKFGKQSVTFLHSEQTMVLNEQSYSKFREDIIEKLGQNAIDYVKNIKL